MDGRLVWYVARASGLIAWALLAASVLWGLAITTRILGGRPRPAWLLDLHRFLGGLATAFVGVHVASMLVDTYVHFSLTSVLVPFASKWHPVAVSWGVASLYLLLAVEITSLMRVRLPKKLWRGVHYATFPLFVTATIHGLSAGTDTRTWAFEALAAVAIAAVVGLTAVRVAYPRTPTAVGRPTRPPARPDLATQGGKHRASAW